MLPFLKDNKNKMITTLMDQRQNRTPVNPVVESKDHPDHDPALEAACVKLLSAIEHKHVQDLRDAIREAFQALESAPHEEHSNPSDTPERED